MNLATLAFPGAAPGPLAPLAVLLQHAHRGRPSASPIEYVLAGIAFVVGAYALVLAVRMTVRPGEDRPDHIKRTILEDWPARRGKP